MSDLPASMPFFRVEAALARFGIPMRDLIGLYIDRDGITTTQCRRDAGGRLVAVGDEVATVVTRIAYDYGPDPRLRQRG